MNSKRTQLIVMSDLIPWIFSSMKQLRTDVQKDYSEVKKKEAESAPKASYGYGGKFGVQQDRMDQVCRFI